MSLSADGPEYAGWTCLRNPHDWLAALAVRTVLSLPTQQMRHKSICQRAKDCAYVFCENRGKLSAPGLLDEAVHIEIVLRAEVVATEVALLTGINDRIRLRGRMLAKPCNGDNVWCGLQS